MNAALTRRKEFDRAELFSVEHLADPYSIYERLRSAHPVYWHEDLGVWIVTGYAEVVNGLRDRRLASNRIGPLEKLVEQGLEELRPIFRVLSDMMLFSDPPKHTRLRGLTGKAFTPRVLDGLRGFIQRTVDALIDAALSGPPPLDLIADLAYPLPMAVIAEIFGGREDGREQFRKWWHDVAAFLGELPAALDQVSQAAESVAELGRYLRSLFEELRRHPRDGLMSAMVAAEEQGDRLSEDELVANGILLMSAGQESTTNLIGNGALALLRHPDQLARLRADASLMAAAVEEFLRYESPVQYTGRKAIEDVQLGGELIRAGQFVMLFLGAANRDPLQFAEPDRLDIGRRDNRHVAFGHGPHFCLGGPLARLQAQIAFDTILKRMPSLRLTSETVLWKPNFALRGLRSLPVFC